MRGALVTESRTSIRQNLFPNPSCHIDTTGYYAAIPAGGAATITRMTDGGFSGNSYARFTCTVAPPGTGGGIYVGTPSFGHIPVTPGTSYTASGFIRSATSRSYIARIDWYSAISGGSVISSSGGTVVAVADASRWVQLSASGTAPAGAAACMITLYSNGGPAFTAGDYYDLDGVVLETRNAVGPYYSPFDGDSPNARWEGTPHASTSLELVDPSSKNLISDSGFNYLYRAALSGFTTSTIFGYWNCPWRTVIDGQMGNVIECVTDSTTQPQGVIILPQAANSPGYSLRPLTQVGDKYTVSAYINFPAGQNFFLGFRATPSTNVSHIDAQMSAAQVGTGTWQRYSFTATITSQYAGYYLGFQVRSSPPPSLLPVGSVIRIARVQVEKAAAASTFEATRPDW